MKNYHLPSSLVIFQDRNNYRADLEQVGTYSKDLYDVGDKVVVVSMLVCVCRDLNDIGVD